MLAAIESALGLINGAVSKRGSHCLKIEALRGELRWIDLDSDRRILCSADGHEPHAGHLRELLREDAVCVIADLRQRKRFRRERDEQDGSVRRVGLAIDRRVEKIWRKLAGGGIDRRLDILRS
jgi:hypothetical protein